MLFRSCINVAENQAYTARLAIQKSKPFRVAKRLTLQRGSDCSYARSFRTASRESSFGRFRTRGFSSLIIQRTLLSKVNQGGERPQTDRCRHPYRGGQVGMQQNRKGNQGNHRG